MNSAHLGAEAFVRASRGARTFPGDREENYWFRRHEAAYLLALRLLGTRRAVLDVGSGEGYGPAMLCSSGHGVVAVELDPVAAAWQVNAYPGWTVVRADACRLPFQPGSFDGIVALQLVEHLYCPGQFVATAAELLAPNGLMVVTTPNRQTSAPDGDADARNPFHVHEYTATELSGLLHTAFGRVRMAGLHPGARMALLGRAAGGSLHHRLARTRFQELPTWLRAALVAVRARDFRLGGPDGSLDLVAAAEQPLGPR